MAPFCHSLSFSKQSTRLHGTSLLRILDKDLVTCNQNSCTPGSGVAWWKFPRKPNETQPLNCVCFTVVGAKNRILLFHVVGWTIRAPSIILPGLTHACYLTDTLSTNMRSLSLSLCPPVSHSYTHMRIHSHTQSEAVKFYVHIKHDLYSLCEIHKCFSLFSLYT